MELPRSQVIDDPNEDKVYVVMEFLSGGPIHKEGHVSPPLLSSQT